MSNLSLCTCSIFELGYIIASTRVSAVFTCIYLSEKNMNKGIQFAYISYCCLATILLFFLLDKGLEITDESFYLLKITYPLSDIARTTLFGEFYSLFLFKTGGIFLLRLINFILLCTAAAFFFFRIGSLFEINKGILYSLGFFSLYSYYWSFFLTTPSYNSMTLSSCLMAAGGMLHILENKGEKISFRKMLILSGSLIALYFAKPTSAALLSLIVILFSFFFLRFKKSLEVVLVVGGLSFFLSLTIVTILFRSPLGYYEGVKASLHLSGVLGGGYDVQSLFKSLYRDISIIFEYEYFINKNLYIVPVFFILLTSWRKKFKILLDVLIIVNLLSQVIIYLTSKEKMPYMEILLYQFVIISFAVGFVETGMDKRNFYIFSLLSFLILIASRFGTNNMLLYNGEGSSVFLWLPIIVASFYFFKREVWRHVYLISLIVITSTLAFSSVSKPYRATSPIWKHKNVFVTEKFNFKLEDSTYVWGKKLRDEAYANGFNSGNFLLDLTGGSPGALLLLDAKFLGVAWILGGYPGSSDFFKESLRQVSCGDIAKAWLLITLDGERRIELKNLKHFGLDFAKDYSCFGDFLFDGHRKETQRLCKPKADLEKKMINCVR